MSVLEQLIPLADAHQAADQYVAGHYWEGNGAGTGCSVGCTIHDAIALGMLPEGTHHYSHAAIAAATKVPEMLWRLADNIFECLPQSSRPSWTPRFLRAAAACTHIDRVPARIMYRCAIRLSEDAIRDDVRSAALNVAGLWLRRATRQQAYAVWQQAYVAYQTDARQQARQQAYAVWQQAYVACHQTDARQQAYAVWQQAYVACQFWQWLADVVCEELGK